MFYKALISLAIILLLMQFFRPAKNISPEPQSQALKMRYSLPANIESILSRACKDCHSNNTRYPWYAEIQPVNWYLASHVNEGKQELNFDAFLTYPLEKQLKKVEEIVEVMENKEMPLTSYTLIHQDADLTDDQRLEIIAWAKKIKTEIETIPAR